MDATQTEKIYVAVGYDVLDGFQTLDWALKKWNSHPNISIIILHVKYNPSNHHVYTLRKSESDIFKGRVIYHYAYILKFCYSWKTPCKRCMRSETRTYKEL